MSTLPGPPGPPWTRTPPDVPPTEPVELAPTSLPPAPAPPPPAGGGRWSTVQLAAVAAVALVVGGTAGAVVAPGGTGTGPETPAPPTSLSRRGPELIDPSPFGGPPLTVPPAVPPTSPPSTRPGPAPGTGTWVVVARLDGVTQKRGELFTLTGSTARLRYESSSEFFAVYVVEEGRSLELHGGFSEATCTDPCADQTIVVKGPGSYYLEARAAGPFSVVLEEER